jgi:two-component system cell cycle response regulator CpdR
VRALQNDGHDVKTACDGGDGLNLIVREEGRFDLLLTDIRMPIMDGIALALSVARDYPNLTILLMTGYADQRERAHGLDAIIHDVLSKPFSVATLRAAVNSAGGAGAELNRNCLAIIRYGIRPRQRLDR